MSHSLAAIDSVKRSICQMCNARNPNYCQCELTRQCKHMQLIEYMYLIEGHSVTANRPSLLQRSQPFTFKIESVSDQSSADLYHLNFAM
jgi:ribosomal protein L40E